MDEAAAEILGSHGIMAISTVRPDGWPQTTIVGYTNDGFAIYFLIFRDSQKFRNIESDDRVSLAIGHEPADLRLAQAVFAAGHALEVTEPLERERAWWLFTRRHPNLIGFPPPDDGATAMMRVQCEHVSVVDYTKGLGHTYPLAPADGA